MNLQLGSNVKSSVNKHKKENKTSRRGFCGAISGLSRHYGRPQNKTKTSRGAKKNKRKKMNKGKIKTLLTKSGLLILAMATLGIFANAQTIDSTLALKMACETSPNNTVTIGYPAKISNGARPPAAEVVNTPCTIVLAPSGSFETDEVAMSFNGEFRIQSTVPTQVKFVKSYFTAPALTLNLRGNDSFLGIDESLLQAGAGNLTVNFGFGGVTEILLPLSGSLNSLEAAGAINFNGGAKLTATLLETQWTAGNGINVFMGGAEGTFKAEKSNLINNGGAIGIRSNSPKALVDFSFGEMRSANGVVVNTPAIESNLVLNTARVFGGAGNLSFNIGANGNVGKAEITDSVLDTNGAVAIAASINAQQGMAKLQSSNVRAGGPATVRSGAFGETLVLNSTLNSSTSIIFSTGASGNCVNDQNNLTAPVIRPCI